ncbi:hypothetical protein FQN49_005429 [Arthroderma sp. PD_2]|nr:hypothetical protein FQN49_005429 [Arthroderma sp. PD_2]
MSFCRNACRTVAQKYGNSAIEHVWVSDELVASTFASFVRRHQRRYGSSIPGPFEARRRLARRRNMDLASAAGPPPGLDAALMLGFSGMERRPRGDPSMTTSPSFQSATCNAPVSPQFYNDTALPIFDIPESGPPPPPPEPSNLTRKQDVTADLACLLLKNPSLNEIHRILKDLDINLRLQPNLSKLIFGHILKMRQESKWTIAEIHTFLGDPLLNTPGSHSHTALINHLTLEKSALPTIIEHLDHLSQGLALGTIPLVEIENMLVKLPSIRTPNGTLSQSNPEQLIAFYTEYWNSLRVCSVLSARELGSSTLESWLEIVISVPATKDSAWLCSNITRALRKMGSLDCHTMSKTIFYILDLTIRDQSLFWESEQLKKKNLRYRFQEVCSVLHDSHYDTTLLGIFNTTEYLITSSRYDHNRPQLLLVWAWMLQRMVQVRDILFAKGWADLHLDLNSSSARSLGKSSSRLTAEEICFLRMWTLRILGHRTRFYFDVDSRRMDIFEKYIAYMKGTSELPKKGDTLAKLQALVASFEAKGLPYTEHVVVAAARSRYQKRMKITGPLPESMITSLNALDCGVLQKPEMIWSYDKGISIKTMGNALFEQIALETDITDPDFVRRMLLYIETESTHHRGVLVEILNKHIPLRRALENLQSPLPSKRIAKATRYTQDGIPILDPQACLNTINFIALIFACSPSTDRVSWRLTHWCYEFLLARRAPILPTLSQALYHAGIRRYRESGKRIPYQRRKFIMRIVRDVEGLRVARALEVHLPTV